MMPDLIGVLVTALALLAQLIGVLVVGCTSILALGELVPRRRATQARVVMSEGIILALSFIASGAFLRILHLRSWNQIAIFSVVLGLRILLKKVFTWEKNRIDAQRESETY
jgi:hypothetical protein